MLKHYLSRYLQVLLGVAAFLLLLILFTIGQPQDTYAKTNDPVTIQQTGPGMTMTPTMTMTPMLPMGQGHMGPMMNMMGMMMQLMGHMQSMHESGMGMMQGAMPMSDTMSMPGMMGMMRGGMPRMGMMAGNKPMTGTVPGAMSMGQECMMPMMQMMQQMHQMMGSHMGMMQGAMPMSGTMSMRPGGMMMEPAMPMTGTMPMQPMDMGSQMQMMGGMLQMMGDMLQEMGHRQHMMGGQPGAATGPAVRANTGLTQTAQIGAIALAVEPLNLEAAAKALEFRIALNTHSGELNFDLLKLSTLRIGDEEITATAWEPTANFGPGAHHVSGILRFSVTDASGKSLLTDGTEVSLIIRNLAGSNEQSFTWK